MVDLHPEEVDSDWRRSREGLLKLSGKCTVCLIRKICLILSSRINKKGLWLRSASTLGVSTSEADNAFTLKDDALYFS